MFERQTVYFSRLQNTGRIEPMGILNFERITGHVMTHINYYSRKKLLGNFVDGVGEIVYVLR